MYSLRSRLFERQVEVNVIWGKKAARDKGAVSALKSQRSSPDFVERLKGDLN
jgi:hypothetical protein